MALNKSQKIPRGLSVQSKKYLEVSQGDRPAIGATVAYYLPVIKEDKHLELWVTVEAGTIVAFDRTSLNGGAVDNSNWLVPANGGNATTVTYGSNDINLTVDIDSIDSGSEAFVSSSGAATKTIAPNIPAGFAFYDYYAKQMEKAYFNTFPQPNVAFVCDYLIEVPLIYDTGASTVTQSGLASGDLVVAGANGEPVPFSMDLTSNATAQASIEQIVGRCVQVKTISPVDSLDKVQTLPGLNLPGTGTSGRQLHEAVNLVGTSTLVSRKALINITLV